MPLSMRHSSVAGRVALPFCDGDAALGPMRHATVRGASRVCGQVACLVRLACAVSTFSDYLREEVRSGADALAHARLRDKEKEQDACANGNAQPGAQISHRIEGLFARQSFDTTMFDVV